MSLYYCDACHYCFEGTSLPDRCTECGKIQWCECPAVRQAAEKEIADLLRARVDDDECDPVE